MPPVFGGDPASARRAAPDTAVNGDGRVRLPIAGSGTLEHLPLAERVARAGATRFAVRAPSLARALEALSSFARVDEVELELADYAALASGGLTGDDRLPNGARLVRATATDVAQAEALLAIDGAFEVEVLLTRETGPWLESLSLVPARIALRQPTYERLTEASERDLDLPAFFARFVADVPVEGVPACILGRAPRVPPPTLDAAMMQPDGRLEIFRYTRRYILEGYRTKSRRCRACKHDATCDGLHINQVRAHGYAWAQPVA